MSPVSIVSFEGESVSDKLGEGYLKKMKEERGPDAKSQLVKVFDEYKELLKDKTDPSKQTESYTKNVQAVLHRLLSAAHSLDEESPGEGIFALFTLVLATNLKLKDKINEVERKNEHLKRQLAKKNG